MASFTTSSAMLQRRRLVVREKVLEAKGENVLMIKVFEEKKLEEAQFEQRILEKCGQLALKLSDRIEELKENDSVALTSKRTETLLARVRIWGEESQHRLETILKLENSPELQRASVFNPTSNLDTTVSRMQRQQQLANASFNTSVRGRRSYTVPSNSKQHAANNNNMANGNAITEEDEEEAQVPGNISTDAGDTTLTDNAVNGNGGEHQQQQQEESPMRTVLPDVRVVEPSLHFSSAKGNRKKSFTIRNRLAEFKLMRIAGVTTPFICKARAVPLAPTSLMAVVIAYKPPEAQSRALLTAARPRSPLPWATDKKILLKRECSKAQSSEHNRRSSRQEE